MFAKVSTLMTVMARPISDTVSVFRHEYPQDLWIRAHCVSGLTATARASQSSPPSAASYKGMNRLSLQSFTACTPSFPTRPWKMGKKSLQGLLCTTPQILSRTHVRLFHATQSLPPVYHKENLRLTAAGLMLARNTKPSQHTESSN